MRHDFSLSDRTSELKDNNFLMRMLYKNAYGSSQ